MKSHQRIEQQESGPQPLGRFQEPRAVRIAVQPQRGGGDHVDFDPGQIEPAMAGHARHPLADHRQGILGQVDQDRPGPRDRILAQAGRAGGHAQGHVQPQPGFGALRRAADHAHRRFAPKLLDQPALRLVLATDLSHPDHGKRLVAFRDHRQALPFFFAAGRWGWNNSR